MTHMQAGAPSECCGHSRWYRAYHPSDGERALMSRQNALAFEQPTEVLAAYYDVWQRCKTLGHSPVITQKKAALAAQARHLLQAGEDEEMGQFRRFCRLFMARGDEQYPPFYDLFAQFWAGQDIVQAVDGSARIINVLPQPVEPGLPALGWRVGGPATTRQHRLRGLVTRFGRRYAHSGGNAGPRRELEWERGQRPVGRSPTPGPLPARDADDAARPAPAQVQTDQRAHSPTKQEARTGKIVSTIAARRDAAARR